jgi:hypothetical protein
MVIVSVKPRGYFLILTDRRLVLVGNLQGRVGKIEAAVPRHLVSAEPLRGHMLTLSMDVTVDGTPTLFSWGRAQAGMARRVATALAANQGSAGP